MKEIDRENKFSDVVMFNGASNLTLGVKLLKVHYPKLTVIHGVEHTVSLFFNDVSKILIVHQIIAAHKTIYNIFGSGCSWADSRPRSFKPFRPLRENSIPMPFIPGRPLYDVMSTNSLAYEEKILTDGIFIPVMENLCRPCTSRGQTLMNSTYRPLIDRSYKPFMDSSLVALLASFLTSRVQTLNCPPYNLIYLANLLSYSIHSIHDIS